MTHLWTMHEHMEARDLAMIPGREERYYLKLLDMRAALEMEMLRVWESLPAPEVPEKEVPSAGKEEVSE